MRSDRYATSPAMIRGMCRPRAVNRHATARPRGWTSRVARHAAPCNAVIERTGALDADQLDRDGLGLRNGADQSRRRRNDLELRLHRRIVAAGAIGDDDHARQHRLSEQRPHGVGEKPHVLFNGHHRHDGRIDILPMRIWPVRHDIGQNPLNIAIACGTHNLQSMRRTAAASRTFLCSFL